MRSGSWILALWGASLADALSLEKAETPAVFNVPLKPRHPESATYNEHVKRDAVSSPIGNNANILYANISLGTPPQHIDVSFWTVGNECWVPRMTSESCKTYHIQGDTACRGSGGYNESLSSTMKDLHSNFTVSKYIESSFTVTGELISDTLVIGNTTVDSMKIGILNVEATQNILGLGYAEANSSFISIPEALVEAGTIKSPAFSIYAEKPIYFPHTQTREEGDRGTLLFGGVNKSKYNGTLHTLPIVENSADGRKAFRVNMTGFSVNEKSMLSDTLPVQALLNPSLSYTYVPESIAERIWSALGITQFPIFGPASVPCNASSSNTTLRFEFGSAKFELDVGLLIETRSVLNRKDFCILNIIAATDANEDIVLGANFLQQLYTVYDMGRDEISLAERNWESSEDEILEITRKDGATGGTSEENKGDADDSKAKVESEDKKSVYDMGRDEISLAERNWDSSEDEILEITRKDGATGGTSEENKGDADDSKAKVESEDKKSVGALVGNSTGLQISFSIFLLWAFFG